MKSPDAGLNPHRGRFVNLPPTLRAAPNSAARFIGISVVAVGPFFRSRVLKRRMRGFTLDAMARFGMSPLVLIVAICCGCETASFIGDVNARMAPNTGFRLHDLTVAGRERRYTVFIPNDYDPRRSWPTIVFLHGLGQAGRDGTKSAALAMGPYVAEQARTFPFIVIFPQSGGGWGDSEDQDDAMAVLDDVIAHYSVDQERVSLTGVSTGGWATWRIGARYVRRFSCLVPMGGQSSGEDVPKLADSRIPIWAFHYSFDPFIPTAYTSHMVGRLQEAGANVKVTYPGGMGHFVWEKAYTPELFHWMAAQHRRAGISAGIGGAGHSGR